MFLTLIKVAVFICPLSAVDAPSFKNCAHAVFPQVDTASCDVAVNNLASGTGLLVIAQEVTGYGEGKIVIRCQGDEQTIDIPPTP